MSVKMEVLKEAEISFEGKVLKRVKIIKCSYSVSWKSLLKSWKELKSVQVFKLNEVCWSLSQSVSTKVGVRCVETVEVCDSEE